MKPRFQTVMGILLCALLVGACVTLWGCDGQPATEGGTSPSAPATDEIATSAGGVTDQTAAEIVLRYFATTAADHMQGVAIEGLQITTQMGQRTLRLDTVSDGSDQADKSLAWLCFGATSEESWTGELNRDWCLGLVRVHIYTTYPWGYSEHSVVDIAGQSLVTYGGAPLWRGGPDTTTLVPASPVSPRVEVVAEETSTTASVPSSTTSTLAPGQVTFDTVTWWCCSSLPRRRAAWTGPLRPLRSSLSWCMRGSEAAMRASGRTQVTDTGTWSCPRYTVRTSDAWPSGQ